jgi:hypothetical protein
MDCRELLQVAEWMTEFAVRTSSRSDLPLPGYLKFKARLEERLSAADRVARPVNAMMIAMGVLITTATSIAVLMDAETRFAAVMIGAFSLLATYASAIVAAAVIAGIVCGVVAYLGDGERERR